MHRNQMLKKLSRKKVILSFINFDQK